MKSHRMADRASTVEWIPVRDIHISEHAQRKFERAQSERIAANFDPDKFGVLVVNSRDGRYWCVDGQHRRGALILMGYDDQKVECQVYEGLNEQQEAEMFLGLNDRRSVNPLNKFLVALTAQRRRELDIARTVQAQGLTIGDAKGAIGCVTALGKVYDLAGTVHLGKALRILRDAYGDVGMRAELIEGMGMVCHRYDGQIDEQQAAERLSSLRGGIGGLMSKAEISRRATARPRAHCVAATVVETLNAGRGGKKLPDWWSS